MSARRRRGRRTDPLGSLGAVRRVLERVRAAVRPGLELTERELVRALRAASHCERTGWKRSRRGRRPVYSHEALLTVWSALETALRQEHAASVSGRTFVENYLRLLDCPPDVIGPLERGRINLFEALQLARVRPETTELMSSEAASLRARVLSAHLAERASARQLNERVDSLLGRTAAPPAVAATPAERALDPDADGEAGEQALDAYLADPGALFADQLRQVSVALSQVDGAALSDAEIDAILDLLDQLYLRALRASQKSG